MRIFVLLLALACLPACSWFGTKKRLSADPTELIVTGAPEGSTLLMDEGGKEFEVVGQRPQVLRVTPGAHTMQVRVGDSIVYREELDLVAGEHRVVTVLSGANRQ